MNVDKVKNNKKQGTPGPWEEAGSGLCVMGGVPPKKAQYAHKNTVCQLPMNDNVTGMMTEKERQANSRRIASLPDLEDAYLKAMALLEKFNKDTDNQQLKAEYQELSNTK